MMGDAAFDWVDVPAAGGRERFWAALLIAWGSALRFFNLTGRQLWLDELVQLGRFTQAGALQSTLNLKREIAAAPLDYIVQHWVMKVVGDGEFGARLHAALFGCLSLLVFYWICHRLLPTGAALTALFLLSCNPLHHWYSQEGRNYALFFFLTVCSFAALLRAFKVGSLRSWALFSLVSVLNLYTNYLASTVLLSQLLFLPALHWIRLGRAETWHGRFPGIPWRPWLAASGVAALAFLPWVVFASETARGSSPNLFLESGLWLRILKESTGGGYPLSVLMIALFILGALRLRNLGKRETWALFLIWLVVPTVSVLALLWWRGYPFSARQTLVVLAPLTMGASMGLEWIGVRLSATRRIPARTALIVLLGTLSLAAIYLHAGKEEADWRGLVRTLARFGKDRRIAAPDIELPLSYLVPSLRRRSVSVEEAMEILPVCGASGESVILVNSRYLAADRISEVRSLLESATVRTTERLRGFVIQEIECLGPKSRGRTYDFIGLERVGGKETRK